MRKIGKKHQDQIDRLSKMSDDRIDKSDISEDADWDRAVIGRFYRPLKKQVTLRLDADMLEWFKTQGDRYQSRINHVLREYMDNQKKAN